VNFTIGFFAEARNALVNVVECLIEDVRNSGTGGSVECFKEILPTSVWISTSPGDKGEGLDEPRENALHTTQLHVFLHDRRR
jgi:hypothetical protein